MDAEENPVLHAPGGWLKSTATRGVEHRGVEHGDPNATAEDGSTALMRSAAKNDDEALRQLLRDGADVNAVNTETGETATAVACRLGHVEALQALYEGHASFFSCTQDARTAAMVAAGNNQWRILEQLATLFAREGVSLKAWVDQQAPDGATAVHYAVANNALEALDCLLRLEASVDIQDHAGRTPIDTAAIDGHLDACRALDSGGSTVRSSMVQYLFDAAAHGREDLSALGVDVNAKDMMGQAALHYAAVKKDMNAFDLLVRAGARLDEVNKCGRSPLHVLLSAGLEAECWEYMNNEAFEPYRPPQGGAAQSPMIRISAEDLRNATNNFSNEALVKVERIYSVYVGKLVVGEKEMRVAIKVLEGDDRDIRLLNEVINLRRAHDKKHIVEILGFCTECFAHVSEFVQEDSLESLLRRSHAQRFHWYDRVRVALEIAEALCQLRRLKPPILHRDLRPTNILLDKKLQTRLVNFGMGCICPMIDEAGGQSTDSMPGEFPYVDPIVLRSHVYVETSDVYALGITMVRLLTGTGENGRHTPVWSVEKALVGGQLHTMLDATAGAWPADTSDRFARLAVECTAINESRRPDIDTVVKVLAKLQANRPKPVEQGPVPAGFTCPITHAIMDDPVCLSDGFTYERSAIKNWLARNMGGEVDAPKRSPMTNAELSSTELYPNTVLRNLIYEWKEQQQEA